MFELTIAIQDVKQDCVSPNQTLSPVPKTAALVHEGTVPEIPDDYRNEPLDLGPLKFVSRRDSASNSGFGVPKHRRDSSAVRFANLLAMDSICFILKDESTVSQLIRQLSSALAGTLRAKANGASTVAKALAERLPRRRED